MAEQSARPDRLTELAGALADGAAIDWAAASSDSAGAERAVLEELRWIAQISSAHASFDAAALHDSILHPTPGDADSPAGDTPIEWGPLRVIEKVGRGTFGDVYRARDRRLDRDVALKLLRRRTTDTDAGEAVIDEARVMARVRHPNIVAIYGADRIHDRVGLWMEFVHGRTLQEEVRERGRFDAADVARIGANLCDALAAMHAAGLVHRDVKAQNVMRDRDGRVLLTDFGTGREVSGDEARSGDGELAGTPLYLAPEVLNGHAATAASDLYSVGVLLYYLSSGRFPVHGRSLREMKDAHGRGVRASLRAARPDLPSRLTTAIDRALDPDPSRRPSADHLARALEAARGGPRGRFSVWRALAAASVVALSAAGIWYAVTTPNREIQKDGGALLLFKSESFVLNDITADGLLAVGTDRADETATSSVVLRDLTTGRITPLVVGSGGGDAFSPVLSPDGRAVAYRFAARMAGGDLGRLSSIRVIGTAPNSQPSTVLAADVRFLVTPVGWSADGRSVLTLARSRLRDPGTLMRRSLSWVPIDGGAPREIMVLEPWREIDEVRLSRDGQWIAYAATVRDSSERHIYVIRADGTGEKAVVRIAGVSSQPVWTPDGTHLVFVSDRSGVPSLWSVAVQPDQATAEPTLLKSGFAGNLIGISRSGTLYYSQPSGGEPQEFVIERQASGARVVQTFMGEKARYSPTGKLIAFVRATRPREFDLIVRSVDNGQERTYPHLGLRRRPVLWLNNDNDVLLHVNQGADNWVPGGAFYGFDLRTRVLTRRFEKDTPKHVRSAHGALSPDGGTLYLLARESVAGAPWTRIVAVDPRTGVERRAFPLPAMAEGAIDATFEDNASLALGGWGGIALSPDGRTLAITRWISFRTRRASLATMGIDGTGYREIYAPFEADFLDNILAWEPGGDAVLVITTDAGGLARVMRIPSQGGSPQFEGIDSTLMARAVPSTRLVPRVGLTLDVSPDGTRLLIASSTIATSEIWTMDDVLSRVRRAP